MTKMNYPTYSKEMRERAKREKKYLVTFDIVRPGGSRDICSQGPMTSEEVQIMYDSFIKVMKERNAASAKAAALDLSDQLRLDCAKDFVTVGVGEKDGQTTLYVYWRTKKAMNYNGGLPAIADGWPVEHKVMGVPRAN